MTTDHFRKVIATDQAPGAIGPYSQAVQCGNTVYVSGQVAIDPATQAMVEGGVEAQATQVFTNLAAVAQAAGGSLQQAVRITIYMTDINNFAPVNEVMTKFFDAPYPARATIGVAALPKGAEVEADAILLLD